MEHTLLTPHQLILRGAGIPYRLLYHLVEGRRIGGHTYHDGNLISGFGTGDDEVNEINELEQRLGSLLPEHRDLRVMVDFCCIWRYDYPPRVHELCAAIGGDPHTAFGLHYQICPQRREELRYYAEALQMWLRNQESRADHANCSIRDNVVEKVFRMLGTPDPLKKMLVERTCLGLSSRFLNCSYWGYHARGAVSLTPHTALALPVHWLQRMAELERAITKELGRQAGDFLCDVGGSAEPACHFKFVRRIDILLSSIGCLRWRGNLPPKDNSIRGRRSITAAYLAVLESYWRDKPLIPGVADMEHIASLQKELFDRLGEQTLLKRWLVASLWKNIKNQTQFLAFPMKRWIEFVRIGEEYLKKLAS